MKKLFFLAVVFIGTSTMSVFCQVTKADFETTISQNGVSKFGTIFLNNIETFYTDGTHTNTYSEYGGSQTTYELGTTSILLKYYTDNTKSTLGGITTVPYSSIKYFVMGKDLTIYLKD